MDICSKCNAKVTGNPRFCPNCGSQLVEEQPLDEQEVNSEDAVVEGDEDASQYEEEYEEEEEEETSNNYKWLWGVLIVIIAFIWMYYKREIRKEATKELAKEMWREKHKKADVIVPNLFDF